MGPQTSCRLWRLHIPRPLSRGSLYYGFCVGPSIFNKLATWLGWDLRTQGQSFNLWMTFQDSHSIWEKPSFFILLILRPRASYDLHLFLNIWTSPLTFILFLAPVSFGIRNPALDQTLWYQRVHLVTMFLVSLVPSELSSFYKGHWTSLWLVNWSLYLP